MNNTDITTKDDVLMARAVSGMSKPYVWSGQANVMRGLIGRPHNQSNALDKMDDDWEPLSLDKTYANGKHNAI